jgi:hypothetical protein
MYTPGNMKQVPVQAGFHAQFLQMPFTTILIWLARYPLGK